MMAAEPIRTAGDDCVLPPEICREILTRLPAKSIIRCRSVSKSWYSLISCPNFISAYSLRNSTKRVLLQPFDNGGIVTDCPFTSHDESFIESHEHDDVPEAFLGSHVQIVGSCHGLICLSKYECHDEDISGISFIIWNPTIRKVVQVPSRTFCPGMFDPSCYGFGFDLKTDDYKVMCMHPGDAEEDADVCEVFDLRKGVWRSITPPVNLWTVGGSQECYLNGVVHWTGPRHVWGSDRILLSFDMSDEIFRETAMPDFTEDYYDHGDGDFHVGTRSMTFGGLIHVIAWKWERNYKSFVDMTEFFSVWVMKEYGVAESWTHLFNIDLLSSEIYQGVDPDKFHLWENGEVLVLHSLLKDRYDDEDDEDEHMENGDKQELLLYNTDSIECKQLFSSSKVIRDLCLYEESLFLM